MYPPTPFARGAWPLAGQGHVALRLSAVSSSELAVAAALAAPLSLDLGWSSALVGHLALTSSEVALFVWVVRGCGVVSERIRSSRHGARFARRLVDLRSCLSGAVWINVGRGHDDGGVE